VAETSVAGQLLALTTTKATACAYGCVVANIITDNQNACRMVAQSYNRNDNDTRVRRRRATLACCANSSLFAQRQLPQPDSLFMVCTNVVNVLKLSPCHSNTQIQSAHDQALQSFK